MKTHILLIDDDRDDRFLFAEALEIVEPQAICYTEKDPRESLNKMRLGHIPMPDLIFLDIHMPVMSGWDCLSMIKEINGYRQVPVIMYSTRPAAEDFEKAKHAGALCLLSKPCDFNDLKKNLKEILSHFNNRSLSGIALDTPDLQIRSKKEAGE